MLAVNHHFRATGDADWLARTYPAVERAARYIISQVDDRGLVFCSADDPRGDVWGIAGWRNIVSGYQISGAVTEINAECVAALRAAGHLAEAMGHDDAKEEFAAASARIRDAMDAHLINPKNGLYYLNIDVNGTAHTDVTGDEIFPVIMRACSEETAFRIISRLNSPDFWTPAGLRTVSRLDPRFDPAAHSGLMGGVWPGLTGGTRSALSDTTRIPWFEPCGRRSNTTASIRNATTPCPGSSANGSTARAWPTAACGSRRGSRRASCGRP